MDDLTLFPDAESEPPKFDLDFYQNIVFNNVNLSDQTLKGIEFYKCKFTNCSFFKTKLLSCQFEDCTFENCDLSLTVITESKFLDIVFRGSKFVAITWTTIIAPFKFDFFDSILNGCDFFGLNISSINFIDCQVYDCDFTKAILTKAKFISTDLKGSKFFNTTLFQTDFSESRNYNINPTANKLKKTIFTLPEAVNLLSIFDVVIK